MSLRIFVFERHDGTLWADYSEAVAKRAGRKIVHTIIADTRKQMEGVIADPGIYLPERVRALAERYLAEFLARGQRPEPVQAPLEPTPAARAAAARKPPLLSRIAGWLAGKQ